MYEGKTIYKAKLCSLPIGDLVNDTIVDLSFVTYFDIGFEEGYLHSGHLEQIALACPNILWLYLRENMNCLQSLQGLEVTI